MEEVVRVLPTVDLAQRIVGTVPIDAFVLHARSATGFGRPLREILPGSKVVSIVGFDEWYEDADGDGGMKLYTDA